jgi:hypothetical protein
MRLCLMRKRNHRVAKQDRKGIQFSERALASVNVHPGCGPRICVTCSLGNSGLTPAVVKIESLQVRAHVR